MQLRCRDCDEQLAQILSFAFACQLKQTAEQKTEQHTRADTQQYASNGKITPKRRKDRICRHDIGRGSLIQTAKTEQQSREGSLGRAKQAGGNDDRDIRRGNEIGGICTYPKNVKDIMTSTASKRLNM